MRKRLVVAVGGYVASVAVLLSVLYWFLVQEGFTPSAFVVGAGAVLALSAGWGYVIASGLLLPQQRMAERLEHATREVLHEINIPVATIEANVAMLEKNETDAKRLKRLGRIKGATKRLERLYRQLRYVLTKEFKPAEKERVELDALLDERVAFFRSRGTHTVALQCEPTVILSDRIGLEQTVDNLLDNALKYSHPGTTVRVTLTSGVLRICDEGEGMDATQIVRVFERYYRGNDRLHGEGIGLAFVKRFCDEQGIDVHIDAAPGKGTCVRLDCTSLCVKA